LTGNVRVLKIPKCNCGRPTCDEAGRVVRVKTCPACQKIRLDVIRGIEYAGAYVKGEDTEELVLLKQKEFFSLQSILASGSLKRADHHG